MQALYRHARAYQGLSYRIELYSFLPQIPAKRVACNSPSVEGLKHFFIGKGAVVST